MGLSFADSLKKVQIQKEFENKISIESANIMAEPMTLENIAVNNDEVMIEAYSGDDGNWIEHTSYDHYDDYSDDNVSQIDDKKNISLHEKQFNITQEENSQYVPFEMNRYYDGFDLTKTTLSIHYITSDEYCGSSDPVNVTYNNDKIRFAWLIDGNATHVAGNIQFEIWATGVNSNGKPYTWKSRSTDKMNVLQSIVNKNTIKLDKTWVNELVTKVAENVAEQIANVQVAEQVAAAETASHNASIYAMNAEVSANNAASAAKTAVQDILINSDYVTKTYVDDAIKAVDVSDQLKDYALKSEIPSLEAYALKSEVPSIEGLATESYVQEQIENADLDSYYKKTETYNQTEIDEKLSNVKVDLTGYATETYVNGKVETLTSSISTNTNSISSLNKTVEEINKTISDIDNSPRVTYEATYGNVEMDDGSTQEYMFTLWETEGSNNPTVKSRFQIMGGGGGNTSSVTLRIAYVDGYTTPIVSTINDKVIIKYDFSGEDSAGDTNLDGTASWKIGNRIIATEDVSTGTCEFDITDYVNVGDNKVVLTITHATGAIATKAWTIKVVDVRLESSFDDTKVNVANQNVNFTFTPYGSVNKTVHFLLDGKEIDTKISSGAASGLSDSYAIPAQSHGTHLFEIYMTADINSKTVESNHIVKDIIWYDESSNIPVIGCVKQEFTSRQYETNNIVYTVYDPLTETPSVSLKSTYTNEDGEIVEEYNSNLVMSSNTDIWQYKTDVIGEHILTITCREVTKTLKVIITELGINITPVITGLVFDFNPVGYSNNDENRLWSYKDSGINMTVSDNFDWINGGYKIDENGDQCFCIKAGTSANINYELFGDDAKANGKQFKLVFKTDNIANANTTFLECLSDTIGTDKVGIEMKPQEANIYAKTESLPLPYAEKEIIEFEFNISSSADTIPLVYGYEDGVSTRPMVYGEAHDFQQHKDHRKTISLGSPDCDLIIYRFKVYNTSLSDRDILNNFIADARSAEEMIRRYDRNQIYQDGILNPEYLAEVCPQLRIIKIEAPRFTEDKDDKVGGTIIECIYKNGDPILDNWVATDCVHSGQGTSSNNYGAAGRNLDLIMKTYKDYGNNPVITLSDGTQVNKVSLTRNSVETNYFNVKVNIASSENANNALLAKRYNDYNPYKRPFVRSDESEIAKIKDTMEFQNCVIFIKESDPDLTTHREFNDNNWHFYAIGNIGDSKKTDSSRLTDKSDKYECILEVMDNTLPLSTMPTGSVDSNGAPVYPISSSEWKAGNSAYDALQAELFDEKKAEDKDNGLADTYGWRYIYEDGTDAENAEVKLYVENAWKDFYEFVVTSTDGEFKANLGNYCVLDSVLYYYLFTLRYTMTDNHAKNSFWHYGKSNDLDADGNPIRKWDLCFDYDNDTALGIDNYGRMTYRYGYEEIDYVDGTSDWVWNAPQHVFFLRIRKLFDEELCALYTRLESLGAWSAISLINQFNDWQMQFPEELWRLDIERKYIRTYTKSFINGAAKPEFLKERANGRKKSQRSQFERNQEPYMSSKFGGTVASSDDIILRCSVPNTELVVPASFDMHLTPYSHIYLNVKYNTSPPVKIRAVPDVEYTIPYNSELADIIEIYSASCLKSIGDLSSCYLINGDFSNASKIRELILGNATEGYNNSNSMTLGLGANYLLNKLDIQNMSGLTSALDLSSLKNLEELYAFGSNVGGVVFADGGNISIAQIPEVGSLSMKNLNYLDEEGFDVVSYNNLSKLVAENSQLNLIDLINNSPNLYQVRLIGVDWSLEDASLLERLYGLAGVTNTGSNTDKSVLAGKVHVPVIRQQQLYDYQSAWSDLEITFDTMIEQFAVTFINDDGTILEVQYVDKGEDAVDPVTREENPIDIPTKQSTVSTDYTYAGWDSLLTGIFSERTITATYSESVRSYTIKYISKGITLQESTGLYGENVPYTGSTPVYTLEESAYKYYLFNRWDKSGFIDGNKTVNAIFDSFVYTPSAYEGKELSDLTPVEIYAMTKLGIADSIIQNKDSYSFVIGNDIDYDDIESELIISEKTLFNGSNYLDTGIKLFDEDKDFVLAIDYEFLNENSTNAVLAQCFQANGSNGFKLWYNKSYDYNGAKFTWGTSSNNIASVNKREIVVIQHKKGDNNLTIYNSNLNTDNVTVVELGRNKTTIGDSTLVFGCAKADDGIYENFAIGNINWCKVWYKDLGDSVCRDLAMWTHEKVTLEACGFRKYYLSDNSSKRCSFSLLATHLLNRNKKWNTANSNDGGWKESELNASLNNRLYYAIPSQIRSLMKQVKVPSSAGSKSVEISTSDCYITIPSCIEVDSTMNNDPYNSEGIAIPYMSTNDSRKRAYDGGNYAKYWLRSPNASYSSYVHYVDTDGAVQGFANPYSEYGILIEISF